MGTPKEIQNSYLVQDLSGDEDPGLQSNQTYMDAPGLQYQVPPGIKNLQQWGEIKVPSGKQQGQTFSEVYDNHPCYIFQIRNRKAVSPWLRSLQNYVIARQKYQMKHPGQTPLTQVGYPSTSQTSTPKRSMGAKGKEEQEWEVIAKTAAQSSNAKKPQSAKRSTTALASPDRAKMTVEPNAERVQQIKTQIALLERELARETQIPEEEDIWSKTQYFWARRKSKGFKPRSINS